MSGLPDADFTELLAPAEALAEILGEIDGFSTYLWDRETFDSLPAITVGVPAFKRNGIEEAESQLHTLDYHWLFPVSLYVKAAEVVSYQDRIVRGLIAVARTIDSDPSLGGVVLDAAITDGTPFVEDGRDQPLAGYQIEVAVMQLVSQPD